MYKIWFSFIPPYIKFLGPSSIIIMLKAYLLSVKQKSILSQIEALAAVKDKIGLEWTVGSEGL